MSLAEDLPGWEPWADYCPGCGQPSHGDDIAGALCATCQADHRPAVEDDDDA